MKDFIEGLNILSSLGHVWLDASHDIILFAGPEDKIKPTSPEQEEKLHTLGFHRNSEHDCWAWFT